MKEKKKRPAPAERVAKPSGPPIPPLRRAIYLFVAVVILPLALLGIVEVGLRIFGVGYPTEFFLKADSKWVANPKFGWRFFSRVLASSLAEISIPVEKPKGTFRIFVFGESAAYGDPEPAFGMPRILEVLLRARFPERTFDVVNVAMPAINSHVILPIARECAKRDGDLWVIYMGNNEVVGPFGPGTALSKQSPPRWLIRGILAMRKLKIAQAAQSLMERSKGEQKFTGTEMFSENRVAAGDPRMTRVHENFARNLHEIVGEGVKSTPVIVCTVGTNLRDCAPFGSAHRADLNPEAKAQWEKLFAGATNAVARTDFVRAAAMFRAAMAIDDGHAELHFRLAKCEASLGNHIEAQRLFVRARDEDTLRFRADSKINRIIRNIAGSDGRQRYQLVDIERTLALQSNGVAPGLEYFYEHVHFNFAGNYLAARAIAEKALPDNGKPWLTQDECAARLGFSESSRAKIADILLKRMGRPPFTFRFNNPEALGEIDWGKSTR